MKKTIKNISYVFLLLTNFACIPSYANNGTLTTINIEISNMQQLIRQAITEEAHTLIEEVSAQGGYLGKLFVMAGVGGAVSVAGALIIYKSLTNKELETRQKYCNCFAGTSLLVGGLALTRYSDHLAR